MIPHTLATSLQLPDATSWHHALGYSPEAAAALLKAYQELVRVRIDPGAYRAAYLLVTPCRAGPLCLQQRMHVEYVLALAYASEADFDEAVACVDVALEIANLLGDLPAEVELHYLGGSVFDAQGKLSIARHHYSVSLQILEGLEHFDKSLGSPIDSSFELNLLIRLAAMTFELGAYEDASHYLADAQVLQTHCLPSAHVEAASVMWLNAQLLHWNGNLSQALTTAIAGVEMLERTSSLQASGRLQAIVADIALDLAESFPSSSGVSSTCLAFATLARPYVKRSAMLTHAAGDLIGSDIARLIKLRLDRVHGRLENRIPSFECIVRRARGHGDFALLGRAYTALGDEYLACNEHESARNCFRRSWRLLEEQDLRAMAHWPRRSYYALCEFESGS